MKLSRKLLMKLKIEMIIEKVKKVRLEEEDESIDTRPPAAVVAAPPPFLPFYPFHIKII